ncbi:dTMP kinase [archaeon]|jgi:dTMP kinase|nr:dTMP kinase [archaeon]MBT3577663.1 dTMP kinase [archaeon]MBT6820070.1 dTMP kinase [archaeon]MBT6956555.1 dTMP kinase [archaeon]MBT7025328.1 dTMP kinase [archaeon]
MVNTIIPGGFYLVMEGPDGCGKSTQCNLLEEALRKEFDVLRIREPGGTLFGNKIRELLLDSAHEDLDAVTELFLFSASRRYSIQTVVAPALSEGKLVLSDRNFYSTEAYQGAGGNVNGRDINYINLLAASGAKLDLAIIFDIDSEEGVRRARGASEIQDKIEARAIDYHKRVREGYKQIAKRDSDVCVLVDGSKSVEEIHDEVYQISKKRIDTVLKA